MISVGHRAKARGQRGVISLVTLVAAAASPVVVLVTLDGVRWQDSGLLGGRWRERGTFTGKYRASNPALLSLPNYQDLMLGKPSACADNACGRPSEPTLVDALLATGLDPSRVAVVASWERIADAATSREAPPGVVDAGLHDGEPAPPWKHARFDRETMRLSLRVLDERRPRLMWISLNDADEHAHRGDKASYEESLRAYAAFLDKLSARLSAQDTLVVTTDHGRGDGEAWVDHGAKWPESATAWLFARGPKVKAAPKSHLDVRPLLGAALGLR